MLKLSKDGKDGWTSDMLKTFLPDSPVFFQCFSIANADITVFD
jgi:hypothetical protein